MPVVASGAQAARGLGWDGQVQSVRVRAGGPPRGRQGHLADLEGSVDHHAHGARDGHARSDLLPVRRPGAGLVRQPDPGCRPLRADMPFSPIGIAMRSETHMAKRWYIVHAYTNFERKVADSIKERAKAAGLEHLFEDVMVPTEEVIEVKRGRKVQAERKFLPGYVLVKMEMTDPAFLLIKNTPKVTGFLGAENKPMPISEDEAMRILRQVTEGVERPKPSITFEVGEQVKVADGPFASFQGHVEEVDEE